MLTDPVGKLALVVGYEFSCNCCLGALVSLHVGTSTKLSVLPLSMVDEFQDSVFQRQEVNTNRSVKGYVLLYQTQILPLCRRVSWSQCRRPHVIGDIILAIFGKYSLSCCFTSEIIQSHSASREETH